MTHATANRAPQSITASSSNRRFWTGEVRRLFNQYTPDNESLKLSDVIDTNAGLEKAIVGAFVLDAKWVASHFDDATPLLLIMSGSRPKPDDPEPRPAGYDWKVPTFAPLVPEIKLNSWRCTPAYQEFGFMESLMVSIHS